MPPLGGSVVFAEDDEHVRPWDFDRDLVSLLQQPAFAGVRGLVIGRFQKASGMTRGLLTQIVASKPWLAGLPVIANVDFGHDRSSPFVMARMWHASWAGPLGARAANGTPLVNF